MPKIFGYSVQGCQKTWKNLEFDNLGKKTWNFEQKSLKKPRISTTFTCSVVKFDLTQNYHINVLRCEIACTDWSKKLWWQNLYIYDRFFKSNRNITSEHVKIVKIPGFFSDFCSKFQVFPFFFNFLKFKVLSNPVNLQFTFLDS